MKARIVSWPRPPSSRLDVKIGSFGQLIAVASTTSLPSPPLTRLSAIVSVAVELRDRADRDVISPVPPSTALSARLLPKKFWVSATGMIISSPLLPKTWSETA